MSTCTLQGAPLRSKSRSDQAYYVRGPLAHPTALNALSTHGVAMLHLVAGLGYDWACVSLIRRGADSNLPVRRYVALLYSHAVLSFCSWPSRQSEGFQVLDVQFHLLMSEQSAGMMLVLCMLQCVPKRCVELLLLASKAFAPGLKIFQVLDVHFHLLMGDTASICVACLSGGSIRRDRGLFLSPCFPVLSFPSTCADTSGQDVG